MGSVEGRRGKSIRERRGRKGEVQEGGRGKE